MRKEFTYLGKLFAVICIALFTDACVTGCRDRETQAQAFFPDAVRGEQESAELQAMQGCGSGQGLGGVQGVRPAGGSGTALAGCLRLAGSSSMEKLSNAWAESFMDKYPGVRVTVEFVGSSAGIEAVISGGADIGNSSRFLKEEEKAAGAVENIVAIDGIAICVDSSNTVDNLTRQQLAGLYTGAVRNWSELGGPDTPVVTVGREAGSGTRGAFEAFLGAGAKCNYANELDSTGAVMARIASTPGAVGYVSMDVIDDSVIVLSLDGVEPTAENIREGIYPLSRPFVMTTKGGVSGQGELVRAWFDYIGSEEGQEIAARTGMVTVTVP